jgi:hypothetical protein
VSRDSITRVSAVPYDHFEPFSITWIAFSLWFAFPVVVVCVDEGGAVNRVRQGAIIA